MPAAIEDQLVDLVLAAVTQVTGRPSDAARAPARRLLRRRIEETFGGTELFLRRAPRALRIPLEVQEPPPAPLPPRRPVQAAEKTFIEIELVDDAGHAVGNERYIVTPPNGAPHEGRLGPDGRARIEGIDPGTCKVSFPDIDGREWRALTSAGESP